MSAIFTFVLVLVALGVTLYPLSRAFGRRVAPRVGRLRELDERYGSALADLQDVEVDRELGNLADPDYYVLRDRYRLRAAAVLAEVTAERDARARLAAALQSRAVREVSANGPSASPLVLDGHRARTALTTRRPWGLQSTLLAASALAVLAVAAIGLLYTRLIAQQEAQAPMTTLSLEHPHVVFVGEVADLWIGHHSGALRSADGRTWRPVLPAGDFMGIVNVSGGRWLALGHEVVWQSRDDAQSWAPVVHDLPGADIHGAQKVGGSIYAYAVGFGIFVTQEGTHWEFQGPAPAGDVAALAALQGTPDILFLAVGGRVMRSSDGGRTWTLASGAGNLAVLGSVRAVAADPTTNVLLAATSDGLFQSTTAGAQWIRLPFKGAVSAVGIRGQIVGLVDDQNQFFLSRDGGAAWTPN
ncbi:MAG: hypothetical protein HY534_06355 [Chloroflexi bacterium]|nr:hypothetical protein [Chloroflexota bacterium]